MSVEGHSRRFDPQPATSGLPPINGHRQTSRSDPFRAKTGLVHRSRQQLHSITSSARASSVGDTVRPIVFAVLRLMISSKRLAW
jgi:hypothetical protein